MQHVLFGSKSIFMGDAAADALIDYGAHVAQVNSGDSIRMRAISAEGNAVTVTFLLNSGTDLVAESASVDLPEPDNGDVIAYMQRRTEAFSADPGYFDGFDGSSART